MAIGTNKISTADLTLAGRTALATACSAVTQRCLDDLVRIEEPGFDHPWLAAALPHVLQADTTDTLVARRFLASLVAVGQKLMDPRPMSMASWTELFAFRLIWCEALPALSVTEEAAILSGLSSAVGTERLNLDRLDLLYSSDAADSLADELPTFDEWFEADAEWDPVHPYVAFTQDQARGLTDVLDDQDTELDQTE